ncbi:hypothetical protein ISCGN_032067 [Ixodes scapularis]
MAATAEPRRLQAMSTTAYRSDNSSNETTTMNALAALVLLAVAYGAHAGVALGGYGFGLGHGYGGFGYGGFGHGGYGGHGGYAPAPTPTVATTSALPSLSPGQLLTDTATADTEADTVLASEASVTEVSEATDTALLSLLQSPRSLSLPPQSLLSATEAMVASDTVDSATVDSATATDTESNKLKHNNVQATSSSRTRVTDLGG